MSGYYLGLLIGSLRVPMLVARVGHVRVFAALLSLGSTTILVQSLFVEPVAWFLMRLLTGYCFAGAFIVAESWLNGSATNENRGSLLSLYMVVQMGSMAAGQFLLNLADPRGFDLFILVSVLVSVAAVPMLMTAVAAPAVSSPRDIGLLGPISAVASGRGRHCRGGRRQQRPVQRWGRSTPAQEGLSIASISTFMAAVIMGGVAVPGAGRAAVRPLDRRWVIAAVALLTAVVALPPAIAARMCRQRRCSRAFFWSAGCPCRSTRSAWPTPTTSCRPSRWSVPAAP